MEEEKLKFQPIDWKYEVEGMTKRATGEKVDPHDFIHFKRTDPCVPDMLNTYMIAAKSRGCDGTLIEGMRALRDRVIRYQALVKSKVPDTKPEEIIEPTYHLPGVTEEKES